MDAILIDLENRHGAAINILLLDVGIPIRWIVIRNLDDFAEILKQKIIAIYCLPFIAEEKNQEVIDLIQELTSKGAIFITPQESEYNSLAKYCTHVVKYPISWNVKDEEGYINVDGTSAACAFLTYKLYKQINYKED